MRVDLAASKARRTRRQERVAENAALAGKPQKCWDPELHEMRPCDCQQNLEPCGNCDSCVNGHIGCYSPIAPKSTAKAPPRRAKKKKSPSRKSLVKKADTAFSLHIRALYPFSFFSGKPTECCFHIVTRSKHSVRWSLDNAVGSTMGENYEMEFNPHKFISILIQKRGLPWYEALVRRSNEIRKHTREDLARIAEVGHDETPFDFAAAPKPVTGG